MIDPYKTLKFFDPLYKVITIKPEETSSFGMRKYWASSVGASPDDGLMENIVLKVINSRELSRLNFLRQSGPAFLVFPSSTHTRYAHSLGTYYLGLEALERCWIEEEGKKIRLKTWIDKLGWRDEFLLSLLLHDIGHLPFSHVIEQNHEIHPKPQCHEEIAASHIIGDIFSVRFSEYLRKKYSLENTTPLSKQIDDLAKESHIKIDKSLMSYLITNNNKYLDGNKNINEAGMIKELVSGLLDLDRFDHYYRDSYFMGNLLARFNVPSFLDDFILTDHGCKLKGDGISQALAFLQSKESMVKFSFQNYENLAYETMLNCCITLFVNLIRESRIKEYENFHNEYIFWTDDELLANFSYINDPIINNLLYRVVYKKPYVCLCKFEATCDKVRQVKDLLDIRNKILAELGRKIESHQLLLRIPKKFGIPIDLKGEWLSLDMLMDIDGNRLSQTHRSVKKEVDYAILEQTRGTIDFWVFVDDELNDPLKRRLIERFEKLTGCKNVI